MAGVKKVSCTGEAGSNSAGVWSLIVGVGRKGYSTELLGRNVGVCAVRKLGVGAAVTLRLAVGAGVV